MTELGRSLPAWTKVLVAPFAVFLKTPVQGAQTSIFAAVDESLDGKNALYLKDCAAVKVHVSFHFSSSAKPRTQIVSCV